MIRCPKCGTMNRDGSRFCNECGAQLQQTKIRCPQCGTLNRVGNIFCDNCNARLVPASGVVPPEQTSEEEAGRAGVQSISLPTIPSAKEGAGSEEEELPDWLRGLDEDEAAEPAAAHEVPEMGEEDDEEFPDWLSSIWGEEEDELPDEPAAQRATPEATDTADVVEQDEDALPDWLSGLPGDEEAAEPEPDDEESLAPSELPAWLSGLNEDDEAESPAAPPSASEADETAEDEEAVAPGALPDWLGGVEAQPSPPTAEAAAPAPETAALDMDLPDWLLATADATQPQPQSSSEAPDWLFADADEDPFPEPEAVDSLPDWLSGTSPEGSEPEPQPEPAPEPEPEEADEDWMGGLLSEEPASEAPETPEEAEEAVAPEAAELPDWLTGMEDEESPETTPAEAQPETEDEPTPDWLSGLMEEGPEAAPVEAAPEEAVPEEAEADIPAWLSGLAGDEGALEEAQAPDEMPDWLSGIESEEAPAFEEAVSGQEAPAPSELPDWLSDVEGAPEEAPEPEIEAQPSAEPPPEAEAPPEAEPPPTAPEPEPEAAPAAGELPDWIQDLGPGAEEAGAAEEVPAEDLARAELPGWLQGLRPPGTGPLPSLPEDRAEVTAAAEEAGGLAPAEIPEWVRQLRPAPTPEGEAPAEKAAPMEPAEQAGPLAGLPGALPSSPIVDIPEAYQPVSQPAFPDDVVEQAKLWQQLLEQPRSVERPIAQRRARRGAGTLAARWITVLLLIAVTVVGLVGVLGEPGLAQAVLKPRVMGLRESIEGLQAGDTVIVAVEYGPAEAGEMTPIANALLEHLQEQDVDVISVSSLPEGAALIPGLLRTSAISNAWGLDRSAYLPGRYNGIGLFLSEPLAQDADLLLIVAARADRLRWWVEQNLASPRAQGRAPLPMNAGVSASIGVLTAPYLETPSVEGWLVGLSDMVAYQEDRGQPRDDALARQLDSLMFAHWVALGLILCGFVYYLISGRKGTS